MQFCLHKSTFAPPASPRLVISTFILIAVLFFSAGCSQNQSDSAQTDSETVSQTDGTGAVGSADSASGDKDSAEGGVVDGVNPAQVETSQTPPAGNSPDTGADAGADGAAAAGADGAAGNGAEGSGGSDSVTSAQDLDAAKKFMNSFFDIKPSDQSAQCLVDHSDKALLQLMGDPILGFGQLADYDVLRLSRLAAKCGDPFSLGMWATDKIKPATATAKTAPICFGDRFAQNPNAFANIVAFFRQSELDTEHKNEAITILAECTPIDSLWDNFISHAVVAQRYTVDIDRQCLIESADPTELSKQYWASQIDQTPEIALTISSMIDSCTTDLYPGLATEIPQDFVAWQGDKALAKVAPPARQGIYSAAPPMALDPEKKYEAIFTTEDGSFTVELHHETAPIAVNSFIHLARDGFYDQTRFHRVIEGFMAQGGDPTGIGSGSAGYVFEDELGGIAFDQPGVLGLANSGPDTNGGQFFITNAAADFLSGQYPSFGLVTEGLDVVMAIDVRDPEMPTGPGELLISVEIVES